jgi:geranylgeranyl diphosphate synthase type I
MGERPAQQSADHTARSDRTADVRNAMDRAMSDPRVDAALSDVETLMRRLGNGDGTDPLGGIVDTHLDTGGKRIRARLGLHALAALGGDPALGVGWAAACELLHNATLIHDDIQDGDRVRRGKPAVWAAHGIAQAINAGDLMLMLPYQAIAHIDASYNTQRRAEVSMQLVESLTRHAVATVRGQALELSLLGRAVDPGLKQAFTDGIVGKTSALFVLPVEGAALLAGRSREDARAIAEPFGHLGVLFQLQDDVLDLYGDKGRGIKGADLREGKVSSLVVEHLVLCPDEATWLLSVLEAPRDDTRDEDVERAIERFQQSGALAHVLDEIRTLERALVESRALVEVPVLHALAQGFLALVLAPIAHVLAQDANERRLPRAARA